VIAGSPDSQFGFADYVDVPHTPTTQGAFIRYCIFHDMSLTMGLYRYTLDWSIGNNSSTEGYNTPEDGLDSEAIAEFLSGLGDFTGTSCI
jgi:hypothetical protein